MAKRNVRITLPTSKPDEFLKLITDVITYHDLDPAASKISPARIEQLRLIQGRAIETRKKADKARREAVAFQEESDAHLGLGKGQTVETEGTGYNVITGIRDELLLAHRGKEEQLSKSGFNVVVTEGPAGGGKAPKPPKA